MYAGWTREDIRESWQRFYHLYCKKPIDYRFICGHCIQEENDMDALDYYIIGVWLVQHRKYDEWSTEKSFDLADILEFMKTYRIAIPRYMTRTKFYRVKRKELMRIITLCEGKA